MRALDYHPELARDADAVVNIDPVARWFNSTYEFDGSLTDEAFPSLRLPWPRAWIEYEFAPQSLWLNGIYENTKGPWANIGAVVSEFVVEEGSFPLEEFNEAGMTAPNGAYALLVVDIYRVFFDDARWDCMLSVFVDEIGSTVGDSIQINISDEEIKAESVGLDNIAYWDNYIRHLSYPILFSVSLMNCKNMGLVDEKLSRQYRRKLERQGKPVITYKTLDIAPFRAQVKRETEPGESQIKHALHICRGNFATYTDDAPLFGKHTGTYWRPMHVRGSKQHGEVKKDYRVITDGKA